MPVNAATRSPTCWPPSCRYCDRTGRRVFIEYLLLDGVNDSPADARRLAGLLRDGRFRVNVWRYNPTDGGYRASPAPAAGASSARWPERGLRHRCAPTPAPTSLRPAGSWPGLGERQALQADSAGTPRRACRPACP